MCNLLSFSIKCKSEKNTHILVLESKNTVCYRIGSYSAQGFTFSAVYATHSNGDFNGFIFVDTHISLQFRKIMHA